MLSPNYKHYALSLQGTCAHIFRVSFTYPLPYANGHPRLKIIENHAFDNIIPLEPCHVIRKSDRTDTVSAG